MNLPTANPSTGHRRVNAHGRLRHRKGCKGREYDILTRKGREGRKSTQMSQPYQ